MSKCNSVINVCKDCQNVLRFYNHLTPNKAIMRLWRKGSVGVQENEMTLVEKKGQ